MFWLVLDVFIKRAHAIIHQFRTSAFSYFQYSHHSAGFYRPLFCAKKLGKQTNNILPLNIAERVRIPLALLLVSLLLRVDKVAHNVQEVFSSATINHISTVLLIISLIWLAIIAVKVFKGRILRNYDISNSNNIKARKIYTQFNILERVIIFVLVLMGIGIVLMSFESIRAMGVTMLSTAGIAGIIIGFAAQKHWEH